MSRRRLQSLAIFISLLVWIGLIGAAMRRAELCVEAGGKWQWVSPACEYPSRPIFIQRDLQRT